MFANNRSDIVIISNKYSFVNREIEQIFGTSV